MHDLIGKSIWCWIWNWNTTNSGKLLPFITWRLAPKYSNSWSSVQLTTPSIFFMHSFFCFFPLHLEMSIVIFPSLGKCIKWERHTNRSSIKPLKSEQIYEPYKVFGAEVPLVNCAWIQILYIKGLSLPMLICLAQFLQQLYCIVL